MELTEQQLKSINQLLAFNSLKPADIEAIDEAIKQADLPAPSTTNEREASIKQLVKLYTAQWVEKISAATSQKEFEELSREAFEKHKNFKSLWANMRSDITNIKPPLSYEDLLATYESLEPKALIELSQQQIESVKDDPKKIHLILTAFLDNSKDTDFYYKKYLPQLNALNELLETPNIDYTIMQIIMGYFNLMLKEYEFIAHIKKIDTKKIDTYIENTTKFEENIKKIKANMHASNTPYKAKLLAKIYDFKLILHKELAIREYSANSQSENLKWLLFFAEKSANSGQNREELKYFNKLYSFLKNELKISLTKSDIAVIHKKIANMDKQRSQTNKNSIEGIEIEHLSPTGKPPKIQL